MDIQGAEAHSTISKPTNCRRQAMAEMQQVVPLHTINRFPREDDLHIREKYAITSLRIYRKVVGCSAGYPSVLQFIPIPQVTRWYILVGYLTTLSSRYARPTWLIASEGEQTSMISKACSSKVCANEHQPDWQVSIAAQEKKATSMNQLAGYACCMSAIKQPTAVCIIQGLTWKHVIKEGGISSI